MSAIISLAVFNTTSFIAIAYGVFHTGFSQWYWLLWIAAIFIHGAVTKSIQD